MLSFVDSVVCALARLVYFLSWFRLHVAFKYNACLDRLRAADVRKCNAMIHYGETSQGCSNYIVKGTYCDAHDKLRKQEWKMYHIVERFRADDMDQSLVALVEYVQRQRYSLPYYDGIPDENHRRWNESLYRLFRYEYAQENGTIIDLYDYDYAVDNTNMSETEDKDQQPSPWDESDEAEYAAPLQYNHSANTHNWWNDEPPVPPPPTPQPAPQSVSSSSSPSSRGDSCAIEIDM